MFCFLRHTLDRHECTHTCSSTCTSTTPHAPSPIPAAGAGAGVGAGNWSSTTDAGVLNSINPANGEVIANVYQCSESDYDNIIVESQKAFEEWRMVPAPIRGQLVREMGEELRRKKIC